MNVLKTLSVSALLLSGVGAHGQDIPNIFTPATPANAADVNENFDHVVERLQGLENRSVGFLMRDGEIDLNVDCTDNPAALNEVYADWWRLHELNFFITGDCYGDITIRREVDENDNWTGASFQPTGQTIHITGADGQTAGIIPNDLTQEALLLGGFGGGLYVNNVTITLGGSSDVGALYSRNAHGGLTNVTINGSEASEGVGVRVQEGAQVYLNNVNVSNVTRGFDVINNGTVRTFNNNSVTSSTQGFFASGSSAIRNGDGTFSLSGTEYAFMLTDNSTWKDGTLTVSEGSVEVVNGSFLSVDAINAANSELSVSRGRVDAISVGVSSFSVTSGDLKLNDASVSSNSSITLGSSAEFSVVNLPAQLTVDYGSRMFWYEGNLDSMVVSNNSAVRVVGTTFTNDIFVLSNSTSQLDSVVANGNVWTTQGAFNTIDNTSVDGTLFVFNGGRIDVKGDTKPLATQISCVDGHADYTGISMLDDAAATECVNTEDARDLQRIVVELRNAANE